MYRCTECKAEYTELPEFCECGNDTFEEIYDETVEEDDYEEEEPVRPTVPKKKRLTPEEQEELEQEKIEKRKSLIVLIIALVLVILLIISPPHLKKREDKIADALKSKPKVQLPALDTIWVDPPSNGATMPLLNRNLSSVSSDLRQYLVDIGNDFNKKWQSQTVQGKGEARIEFTIDKLGVVKSKLSLKSENDDLNNSVLLLLSKVTNLDPPPSSYKGERIIMSFTVDSSTGYRRLSYPPIR